MRRVAQLTAAFLAGVSCTAIAEPSASRSTRATLQDRVGKIDPSDPRYRDYRESSLADEVRGNELRASPVREGNFFFVSADWGSGFRMGEINGVRATVAWVPSLLGVDFTMIMQSLRFGAFHVDPNPGESTTDNTGTPYDSADPSSELNRTRDELDSWSQMLIGPSITVTGRLMPDWVPPLWSQRARFGVMRASFKDQVNSITFSGWVVAYDVWVQYQLGSGSHWAVDFGITHAVGAVTRSGMTSQQGRLPVSWVQSNVGLSYWF